MNAREAILGRLVLDDGDSARVRGKNYIVWGGGLASGLADEEDGPYKDRHVPIMLAVVEDLAGRL